MGGGPEGRRATVGEVYLSILLKISLLWKVRVFWGSESGTVGEVHYRSFVDEMTDFL